MSTRSTIAILYHDGSVDSNYCHSDGYLSYNGLLLYKHYQDPEKVKQMISLGGASLLAENIEPAQGQVHTFEERLPLVSVFYKRDRGADFDMYQTKKYDSLENYFNQASLQTYNYLYNEKEQSWYLLKENPNQLLALSAALLEDNFISEQTKLEIKNDISSKQNISEPKKLKI